MRDYHKPVIRSSDVLEALAGDGDPATASTLAHDTALSLLHRIRRAPDPRLVDAVITYADQHGIDDVAELWSASAADTLPGALWRLYLLRHTVAESPEEAGYRFRRGLEVDTVGQALAGSASAPTPEEVVTLATDILRGAFTGDFADALERAGGFARVMAAGSGELAANDDNEARAGSEARRHEGFATMSDALVNAANLWRKNQLA